MTNVVVKQTANKKGLGTAVKQARTIVNKGGKERNLINNIKFILRKNCIVLF